MPNTHVGAFNYFAQVLQEQPSRTSTRVGVVTATSPFTVNLQGALLKNLGRDASYTPVVGHVVALERQDQTWMCVGRVVPG